MDFTDLVFHHALTRPQKPAIILPDRVVTYGMMAQGIRAVTDRLHGFSLQPGDLVSVAIASPIRHLIVAAALARRGLARLSVRQTAELSFLGLPVALYLEDSPQALIPGLKQALVEDDWFTGAAAPADARPAPGFASAESVCMVSLSSGTTGRPKAISFSVDAFDRKVRHCYFSVGLGQWDRMLCLPGLPSNWGFTLAAHALYAGKTLLFADTPTDTLQLISVYGVDCLAGSPGHLRELIEVQRRAPVPCPSLRVIFTGGSLASRTLLTEAAASLCATIIVQYGSTEAGGTAFSTADRLAGIEGASGFVAPWAKVEIVDEADRPLPPGTDGILRVWTSCLGRPYPDSAANADASFRDGWFYPGDIGRLAADGLLIVSGRNSEIINAGGAKRAPELIEEVARQHPDVADAAAFAGADGAGIEAIWLAIVPRAPVAAADIVAFCTARGLPVARVVTVGAIPRNAMGKIERLRLKGELTG